MCYPSDYDTVIHRASLSATGLHTDTHLETSKLLSLAFNPLANVKY